MKEKIGQGNEKVINFGPDNNITHGSIVIGLRLNTPNSRGWYWQKLVSRRKERLVNQRKRGVLPSDWNRKPFSLQRKIIDVFQRGIIENRPVPFNNELADLLKMPRERLKKLVQPEEPNDFITVNAENLVYLILQSGITHLKLVRNTQEDGRIVPKSVVIPIEQSADGQDAYLLRQLAVSVVANSIHDSQFCVVEPIGAKRKLLKPVGADEI